jgi:hypothetical protein
VDSNIETETQFSIEGFQASRLRLIPTKSQSRTSNLKSRSPSDLLIYRLIIGLVSNEIWYKNPFDVNMQRGGVTYQVNKNKNKLCLEKVCLEI